jgi:hypothetical protein
VRTLVNLTEILKDLISSDHGARGLQGNIVIDTDTYQALEKQEN